MTGKPTEASVRAEVRALVRSELDKSRITGWWNGATS